MENVAEFALPAGTLDDLGRITNEDAASAAIRDAMRGLGVKASFAGSVLTRFGYGIRCVSSMPSTLSAIDTFPQTKNIHDPKRARRNAELRAAEFAKDPPLDKIDDCSVVVQNLADTQQMVVVKTLREALLQRDRVFRSAGCGVILEHEGWAFLRALPNAQAVVDIGRRRTLLVARSKIGVPICVTFKFGGEAIAERVSRGAALDDQQTEHRMRSEGVDADFSADWLVDQFVGELEHEIKRLTHDRNILIQRIVLTGNGSRIPGLLERIRAKTMTDVKLAGLEGVRSDQIPPKVLADAGPSLTLAIGLAAGGAPAETEAPVDAGEPSTKRVEAQPA